MILKGKKEAKQNARHMHAWFVLRATTTRRRGDDRALSLSARADGCF